MLTRKIQGSKIKSSHTTIGLGPSGPSPSTAGGRRLVQPLSQPRRTPRALEPQHSPQHWLWVRTASPHSQVRTPCTLLPLLPKRWHGRGRSDAVQCRREGRTKAAGAARAGTEGCCCRARECLRRAGASNERGGRGGWFHSEGVRAAAGQGLPTSASGTRSGTRADCCTKEMPESGGEALPDWREPRTGPPACQ